MALNTWVWKIAGDAGKRFDTHSKREAAKAFVRKYFPRPAPSHLSKNAPSLQDIGPADVA